MAQWTQTLEPYIRVHEEVKSMALNPTAGEDLIIGVTFISDAGPSTPTLIRGQKEFLATYTSQDLTQEYVESLNQLYTGDDHTLASTMWANAYRLSGSNTILAVRASKANGMYFAKPLVKGDLNTYILRDGELLKKVPTFKLVIDHDADSANHDSDGWLISINGVGAFGNRTTDDGAQYDYFVNDLPSLVDNLNDTSKFFSPSYTFYRIAENNEETEITESDPNFTTDAKVVVFKEVYLGSNILDESDPRTYNRGLAYIIACETDWTLDNPEQHTIDLNSAGWSGFTGAEYYATNVYNSATPLAVRIRRFNHDAVVTKELSAADKASLNENGKSPYSVLKNVLDTYTHNGTTEPTDDILKRDFFELAVFDPSVNGEVSFFNIGNVLGRGDMEVSEVNSLIKMIQVNLPDDLHDLGLNYYGYGEDDYNWVSAPNGTYNTARWTTTTYQDSLVIENVNYQYFNTTNAMYSWNATANGASTSTVACIGPNPETLSYYQYDEANHEWEPVEYDSTATIANYFATVENMNEWTGMQDGNIVCIGPNPESLNYYQYNGANTASTLDGLQSLSDIAPNTIGTVESATVEQQNYVYTPNGESQLFADLTINPMQYMILSVSDSDLKKAMDQIMEDEVYTTEGLSDLGNTELSFQSYLANMAISEDGNYFYPISTVNSTNYMTIGNSATKISQDSYKLYMSAPWDIDTGTLGWKFYASPSVLYWESVARNRRNNNEFASILGQSYGLMQYQRPVTEFNKKTRQLLLSRRVNTNMWNVATQAWNMNDCYTKQNENNIMSEDGNSRLMIRISKAMPVILRQFIGRKITEPLCAEVRGVIDYFFRTTIIPMNVTVDAYQIFCDFDEALARQNKIKVVVNCRYSRSLKFIEVYNRAFDVGMDISNPN